jgi:pathogenesis-related protein 1
MFMVKNTINRTSSITIIVIALLVTAAILTVQSSMLQLSHAQSRLDATTQNTILDMHNQERAAVGVPAVTWNSSVAAGAQNWANYIVSLGLRWDLCNQDSTQCPYHGSYEERNGQGENIAWGFNTPVTSLAQLAWANEKRNYVPGTPYDANAGCPNCYWHYTMMVWSTTTQIGCGIAQQTIGAYIWDIVVCRYSPAGNIVGQTPYDQGAAAVAGNETTLADQARVEEEEAPPAGQAAVVEEEEDPPAGQAAVVEEEVGGEVIQEVPPQ